MKWQLTAETKMLEESCLNSDLSNINTVRIALELGSFLRAEKLATNHLSYGKEFLIV
jgi:hypothetical protein